MYERVKQGWCAIAPFVFRYCFATKMQQHLVLSLSNQEHSNLLFYIIRLLQ